MIFVNQDDTYSDDDDDYRNDLTISAVLWDYMNSNQHILIRKEMEMH